MILPYFSLNFEPTALCTMQLKKLWTSQSWYSAKLYQENSVNTQIAKATHFWERVFHSQKWSVEIQYSKPPKYCLLRNRCIFWNCSKLLFKTANISWNANYSQVYLTSHGDNRLNINQFELNLICICSVWCFCLFNRWKEDIRCYWIVTMWLVSKTNFLRGQNETGAEKPFWSQWCLKAWVT